MITLVPWIKWWLNSLESFSSPIESMNECVERAEWNFKHIRCGCAESSRMPSTSHSIFYFRFCSNVLAAERRNIEIYGRQTWSLNKINTRDVKIAYRSLVCANAPIWNRTNTLEIRWVAVGPFTVSPIINDRRNDGQQERSVCGTMYGTHTRTHSARH